MDVRCGRCGTEYDFDDALVSERGTTVQCTDCGLQFKIFPREPRKAPERWVVRSASDATRQYEFTSLKALQRAIQNGEVGPADWLSRDGDSPRRLGAIEELEPLFRERPPARSGGTLLGIVTPETASGLSEAPPTEVMPVKRRVQTKLGIPSAPLPLPDSALVAPPPPPSTLGEAPRPDLPDTEAVPQVSALPVTLASEPTPTNSLTSALTPAPMSDVAPLTAPGPLTTPAPTVSTATVSTATSAPTQEAVPEPAGRTRIVAKTLPSVIEPPAPAGSSQGLAPAIVAAQRPRSGQQRIVSALSVPEGPQPTRGQGEPSPSAEAGRTRTPWEGQTQQSIVYPGVPESVAPPSPVRRESVTETAPTSERRTTPSTIPGALRDESLTPPTSRRSLWGIAVPVAIAAAVALVWLGKSRSSTGAEPAASAGVDLRPEVDSTSGQDELPEGSIAAAQPDPEQQDSDSSSGIDDQETTRDVAPEPPPARPAPGPIDYRDRLLAASQAAQAGDPQKAEQLYRSVLEERPGDTEALAGLADLAQHRGDNQKAAQLYEEVLDANPSYVPALMGRANQLWDAGERFRALEYYQRVIERVGTTGAYGQRAQSRIQQARTNSHAAESDTDEADDPKL